MEKIQYSYLAIDVAKETLHVHTEQRSYEVGNNKSGIGKVLSETQGYSKSLVVVEASGGYEQTLLDELHAHRMPCNRVNPALVRNFARSEGIKAKTDKIDARMLWRFACSKQLQAMPVPVAEDQTLAALLNRRKQLSDMLVQEKVRLQQNPKCVLNDIRGLIRTLERKVSKIDKEIEVHIESSERLKQRDQVIRSVKGVGAITSSTILAFLPEITSIGRNQLVALAGLAPFNRDSGKYSGKRSIHAGRAKVRKCLYMAAVSAARYNPVIKAYVSRLIDRGKAYKCAIVAAMRKLIIHIQSLLKKCEFAT